MGSRVATGQVEVANLASEGETSRKKINETEGRRKSRKEMGDNSIFTMRGKHAKRGGEEGKKGCRTA